MANNDKYPDLGRYGYNNGGFTSGNPMADVFLSMYMGQTLSPRPSPGTTQSTFDAFLMRERNLQFMQARSQGLANNMFFQKLGGVNQNSFGFGALNMLGGDPDGPALRMLSPFIGGNPVKAQMGMFANLSGQSMGALGSMNNVTVPQTTQMMNDLYKRAYVQGSVTDGDVQRDRNDTIKMSQNLLKDNPNLYKEFERAFKSNDGYNNFRNEKGVAQKLSTALDSGDKVKMEEAGKEFIKSITDPQARKKMEDQFAAAIQGGTEGAKKFRTENIDPNLNQVIAAVDKHMAFKKQDNIPVAMNFQNTRGFKLEDLTQGFTGAVDFRMIGKGDVNDKMKQFLKNGPGVMSAARGLFGNNKSGGELMEEISGLMGNSFADLSDQTQSHKLEDLLRNVKSAARTAGISIEAILGIIGQGKQLASMHPELSMLGGADIAKMAIRTTNQSTALGAFFGNDYMRRNGGPVGVAQTLMTGEIAAAGEPITQRLGAYYEFFHQRGNEKAKKDILAYATNEKADHTRPGENKFANSLAQRYGFQPTDLRSYADSAPEASARGLSRAPELAEAAFSSWKQDLERAIVTFGRKGDMERYKIVTSGEKVDLGAFMKDGIGGDKTLMGLKAQAQKALGNTSVEDYISSGAHERGENADASTALNSIQNITNNRAIIHKDAGLQQYLIDSGMSPDDLPGALAFRGKIPNQYIKYGKDRGYDTRIFTANNPRLAAAQKQIAAKGRVDAEIEKQMDKDLSFLNAPMTTSLFNNLLDGTVDRKGLTGFLDSLKNPMNEANGGFGRMKEAGDKILKMNLTAEGDTRGLLTAAGLTEAAVTNITTASNQGMTAEQLQQLNNTTDPEDRKALIAKYKSENPKLKGYADNEFGFLGDSYKKLDPEGKMKGKLDFKNIRRSLIEQQIQGIKNAATSPTVEKLRSGFNDMVSGMAHGKDKGLGKEMDALLSTADDFGAGHDGILDPAELLKVAGNKDFRESLKKHGSKSFKTLDMLTQAAQDTEDKISRAKNFGAKDDEKKEMADTLKKILKSIGGGGEGGETLIDVLTKFKDAVETVMNPG